MYHGLTGIQQRTGNPSFLSPNSNSKKVSVSINHKKDIETKKCTFYGYLPLRNGARALTPRSGNVDPAQWRASGRTRQLSTPHLLLLSFLLSLLLHGRSWDLQREVQVALLSSVRITVKYGRRPSSWFWWVQTDREETYRHWDRSEHHWCCIRARSLFLRRELPRDYFRNANAWRH